MKLTDNRKSIILFCCILCISMMAAYKLMMSASYWPWLISDTGYPNMFLETGIIGIASFSILVCLPICRAIIGILLVLLGFAYVHVFLVPFLVAIGYVSSLFVIGYGIRGILVRNEQKTLSCFDFVLGCSTSVLISFVLSFFQIGNIRLIRIIWMVLAILTTGIVGYRGRKRIGPAVIAYWRRKDRLPRFQAALFAIIIVLVITELGRCNGAADYDSRWYGLRPESVLTDGTGVFEDLGLIGLVFWYPKLYEILMLPVSGLSSHAYLVTTNAMFGVLALFVVYRIVELAVNRVAALFAVSLCASIPSFAVMMIHVKPDMITVLLQLIMLYFAVAKIKGIAYYNVAGLLGSWLFSLGCKPTAIAFSNVLGILLMGIIFSIGGIEVRKLRKSIPLILPMLIALGCSLFRTYSITGIPMNSIGGMFFEKLGFEAKEPYTLIKTAGGAVSYSIGERIADYFHRLFVIWIYPYTEKYGHISLAWVGPLGITLCVMLLIRVCSSDFWIRYKKEPVLRAIFTTLGGMLCVCMGSVFFLNWIDGNYFLILYVLLAIAFGISLDKKAEIKRILICLCSLILFNWCYSGMHGWAEDKWFRYTDLTNPGYVDDRKQSEQELRELFPRVYDILASDRSLRIAAEIEHMLVSKLPNVAEGISMAMIHGNPRILDSSDAFLTYLVETQKDYILTEQELLRQNKKLQECMEDLFRRGYLSKPIVENDYLMTQICEQPLKDNEKAWQDYLDYVLSGDDLDTCEIISGPYEDGWIGKYACYDIKTNEKGIIHLSFYGVAKNAGESGYISINGERRLYTLQEGSFEIQYQAEKNSIVRVEIDNSAFARVLSDSDIRELSVILLDIWTE